MPPTADLFVFAVDFMVFMVSTLFFFFNDTATTEIYTLSLHDALPIYPEAVKQRRHRLSAWRRRQDHACPAKRKGDRSEEHTSELQSRPHLVCRLLLEKKKLTASTDQV